MKQLFPEIITNDPKMFEIFEYIEATAPSAQAVLITGDTGVGKELIARAVHVCSGRKGNFVAVNVAGLDDNIFSDTLFGHERGAFTGADRQRRGQVEQASGGTLFLDEIGDLSPASQVKLLRLLQEGEYLPLGRDIPKKTDCRIVAATNEDLWELQKNGRFRKDLNFRLRTHHIHVPPLRDRLGDIALLVDHFLERAASELRKKTPTPPPELYPFLETYSFPGNIRELQAMIFDAVSQHKNKVLSLDVFKLHILQGKKQVKEVAFADSNSDELSMVLFPTELPSIREATLLLVREAMKRAKNNQSLAAQMLGISRQALAKRLKNLISD
jgi:DNA-binding NtrC family response regulator